LAHDFGKAIYTEEINGVIHAYEHEKKGLPLAETFLRRITAESKLIRYVLNLVELHMKPNTVAEAGSSVKTTTRMFEQDLIMKQSQGAGRPNKIYIKIPAENCLTRQTENSPTGQAEKSLTSRAFFDPKSGRKVPTNNNKRNKYVRNYDFKEGENL
jgi:hypothetical protein